MAAEAGGHASGSNSGSSNTSSSSGGGRPTVLWDYLTSQYQQDVLTVLAASEGCAAQQQRLLEWLMTPVTPAVAPASDAAGAEASSSLVAEACGGAAVVADVDPLAMVSVLDELLLAAIDAAEPQD